MLFATRSAARQPGLRLAATVAVAPASRVDLALPAVIDLGATKSLAFAYYTVVGLSAGDASVDLNQLLGLVGQSELAKAEDTACLIVVQADLAAQPVGSICTISPPQLISLDATIALYDDPGTSAVVGPVFVAQGSADTAVNPSSTASLVSTLQELGSAVNETVYSGATHSSVVPASICDQLDFLAEHGGVTHPSCG